jgi:hypothetical protein
MIQRKQTLFLLAVLIIGIVMIFLPFQTLNLNKQIFEICLMPSCCLEIIDSTIYYPMILNFFSIIVSIITIFQFKKRVLQFKLSNSIALLNVFIIGLFFLLSYINKDVIGEIHYTFGAFLPILSIIFAFLAAHFIKKDEQLVRNSDRIR